MRFLDPSFSEEFYPANNGETLLVDLWAYLNARQANLPWDARGDWLWVHIEEVLSEIEPVFAGGAHRPYDALLQGLAERWRASAGGSDDAELRRELGSMLHIALETQRQLGVSVNGNGSGS